MRTRSTALGLALLLFTASAVTASARSDSTWTVPGASLADRLIPYSAPDLPNPLRGQYANLQTELFPQANPADDRYPAWPDTHDVADRFEWSQLQPRDPRTLPADASDDDKYDFSAIDEALRRADAQGKRLDFRVAAFNSCCDAPRDGNTVAAVPDWIRHIPGATADYPYEGRTYVIPQWDDETYLRAVTDLIAALGRRYDNDERLAVFELSGYGDFSENHVTFMRDALGIPGPTDDASGQQLGYYSQYGDQYITQQSVDRLVDANLHAFRNTRIVTTLGNPAIVRRAMVDSPELAGLRKPVGLRSDALGTYPVMPTWAADEWSHYVRTRDPLIAVLRNRFRTAPVITEWPSTAELWDRNTHLALYEAAVREVIGAHVSMTASTGFPDQLTDQPIDPQMYRLWADANKFAGYRYAPTGVVLPAESGQPNQVTVQWSNFGSAPTYDAWRVIYEIVDSGGTVVRAVDGRIHLSELYAETPEAPAIPPVRSTTDTLDVGSVPPGTYSLRVRVEWAEHKPDATATVRMPPMNLAIGGRSTDGSYPLAQLTVP